MSSEVYSYNYSAQRNKEVQAIRNKYLPQPESKLEELRRLDKRVHQAGMGLSIAVGTVGCLVFGTGMCLALGVLPGGMALGIAVGLVGAAIMPVAYPIHRNRVRSAKEQYQPRILDQAAELCSEK